MLLLYVDAEIHQDPKQAHLAKHKGALSFLCMYLTTIISSEFMSEQVTYENGRVIMMYDKDEAHIQWSQGTMHFTINLYNY